MLNKMLFNYIHKNHLIYNTCWEDPECDRELMQFDNNSDIVMITSAGCNALDYLLDNPNSIHCVDMNPRQNALLQLKQALFRNNDYQELYQSFGVGTNRNMKSLFDHSLKYYLSDEALRYWTKHLYYFFSKGIRKSFYNYGTTGFLAWVLRKLVLTKNRQVAGKLNDLLEADNLEVQRDLYAQLEPELLNKTVDKVINTSLFMSMIGVPAAQSDLLHANEAAPSDFVKESLRNVFTRIPLRENYFWRLYIKGHYDPDCCPNYLKHEHFSSLKDNIEKISTHTSTISDFLRKNPKVYSHFVLLDHMDWLVKNDIKALEEEWRLILDNSRSGSKVLLRSASKAIDFLPNFVHERITFDHESAQRTHQKDRVGTYGSVMIGTVN
jgi:S-adenosylmethionine-diacylglycerol 3-amino-3-carboxypropyl transferase